MRIPSEGLRAYNDVAEELSDPNTKLSDLDQAFVAQAKEYAKRTHKRWPPRPQTSGWIVTIISL